ncbi:hypothetical protein V5O48_009550 [Marasmius crinis-equi]|uniref:Replication factor A protein 3 n=1 Tax=Marasmius crinis-equi TaxID=585013 RepID=A0ABR3FB58_9AGAR
MLRLTPIATSCQPQTRIVGADVPKYRGKMVHLVGRFISIENASDKTFAVLAADDEEVIIVNPHDLPIPPKKLEVVGTVEEDTDRIIAVSVISLGDSLDMSLVRKAASYMQDPRFRDLFTM